MRLIRGADGVKAFWAELKPCDHVVEMYEAEDEFVLSLESYVHGGIAAGENIVLIATPAHLEALEQRLLKAGLNLCEARAQDRYIELDAEETLARFMVNGWPDAKRFQEVIGGVLARASSNGARVRAFGEMVAILWAKKLYAATVQLEHLWQRLCGEKGLSLLCAYPVSGPTDSAARSMREICEAHSHVITRFGLSPS
jgi:hypothetical protein